MEPSNGNASQHNDGFKWEGQQQDQGTSASVVAPIHWQHRRYESYASVGHTRPTPISLEDNTEEPPGVKSPLWAKAVVIDDHTVVSGSLRGVGDYIIWNCKIHTLDVSFIFLLYVLPISSSFNDLAFGVLELVILTLL